MSKSPCSRTLPHEAREQGVFNFLPFLIIYYEHEKAPSITILFIPVYVVTESSKLCDSNETVKNSQQRISPALNHRRPISTHNSGTTNANTSEWVNPR